ncbi:response regulator [Cohnella sp. GCM10012308]|uniref:response regulator n=1 Tax=Cohnella sp. GCM10012308 TaxID=3317329 RepID=UPI00360AF16F
MYRLLIVDDLPVISNGLAELFEKESHLPLEVYKAYSGFEALELMKRYRIDIVLSDIIMPGMDGIELLRQIRRSYPICKVILLTSHSDFNYVQSAMSLGGMEYLLKTESDEVIVQSVEKAIQSLEKEYDARRLIEKAEAHMKMALPSLQKEYLWMLLQGKKVGSPLMAEHFSNLQLPFHPDHPVFLLLCRVDDWNEITTAPDKALMIYAAENIAEEFFSDSVNLVSLVYESSKMIWILQPQSVEPEAWERTFHYVNGMMEMIQSKCQQLLKLSISFVLGSREVPWPELAERFHALKFLFVRGLGWRRGILLTDEKLAHDASGTSTSSEGAGQQSRTKNFELQSKVQFLLNALENASEEEFYRIYEDLSPVFTEDRIPRLQKLELYHAMALVFLTFVNKYDLERELGDQMDWSRLAQFDDGVSWPEWSRYFLQLAHGIISWNINQQEQSTHEVVKKVHEFIESHLSTDISLIHLADHVNLNPSYLSRLYKQITGNGLSDYLMEFRDRKAKELLKKSPLKVHEIAAELGYNSSHAFIRFFKKQNRITPQEYREQWGQ